MNEEDKKLDEATDEGIDFTTVFGSTVELDFGMEKANVVATGVEKTEEIVTRVLNERLTGCMNALMEKMLGRMATTASEAATPSDLGGRAAEIEQVIAPQSTTDSSTKGRPRSNLMEVGAIIKEFDPDDRYSNVTKFLSLIDDLGDEHGWSEYERTYLMHVKLRGPARSWLRRLDMLNYSWEQWKENLQKVFPRQHDFYDCMVEMMERRKRVAETMTSYFHAKLALCERVKVTGENAVSCIIKGLPKELWTNAFACKSKTPEALYCDFLSGLERYKSPTTMIVGRRSDPSTSGVKTKKTDSSGGPPTKKLAIVEAPNRVRCYNCQEYGTHISRDCPHPKSSRCSWCGKEGHWFNRCPARQEYMEKKGDNWKGKDEKRGGAVKTASENKVSDAALWNQATVALAEKDVDRKVCNKYESPY